MFRDVLVVLLAHDHAVLFQSDLHHAYRSVASYRCKNYPVKTVAAPRS